MDANSKNANAALADLINKAPLSVADPRVDATMADLEKAVADNPDLASLAERLKQQPVRDLLSGIYAGSPYLCGLLRGAPERLQVLLSTPPDARFHTLCETLAQDMAALTDISDAMRVLRIFKSEVALLLALADLGGVWPVMRVTEVLSETADAALQAAVRFLFRRAVQTGDWLPDGKGKTDPERPDITSGYIVLAMGKHGARELNYSSDIDLIIFFDPERASLRDGLEPQTFFVRMTRDLVQLMDERTRDGYVFRTDLRLRPDAGATQAALSRDAALYYYESVGQNWERAALLKARPIAGDLHAGEEILEELAPFIWRKYLDFAAISDIHAMKRQVHAFRGLGGISLAGHNVKLGRGGIREIEFFVQTQQLIAGGRQPELRVRQTLKALRCLEEREWITGEVRGDLDNAYRFLRSLEHRIQMVADEQTHELPNDEERLGSFARFCGYESTEALANSVIPVFETVQKHYAALFEDDPDTISPDMNLVFAGEDDDPDTVSNLKKMGFKEPQNVLSGVRAWHRGRYPAVSSQGGRERLTQVQPFLIQALSETADPDRAFVGFDRFLSELPTGVQLFAILKANPSLLKLFADIMGTAPRMARILSRRRRLLDAVLDPRTFSVLPDSEELDQIIAAEFAGADDFSEILDRARIVGNEQMFLIGVRVLTGTINASKAGGAYALLAARLIIALEREVQQELSVAHGEVAGGGTAVVAMGKLGGWEMTASSDLDLIIVYDLDSTVFETDGAKPLAPSQYYARLTQRLITALGAPTPEGALYEVDMRLRPSGNQGPVATALSSFIDYQTKEAWTWEHMALTRARVVSGSDELRPKVEAAIHAILVQPRDPVSIAADVREMRQRIWDQKKTENIWNLKQVRGGFVDLEFVTQYLQLIHANSHPEVLDQNTVAALRKLADAGCLAKADGDILIAGARMLHDLGQILKLCLDDDFEPEKAPNGLKELLARASDSPSFAALEAKLRDTLAAIQEIYERTLA